MSQSEIRTQLEECFAVVFPDLTPDEIPTATMESVDTWDSLATLTLVGVVEQMFAVRVEIDDIAELVSFEKIATWLESQSGLVAA